MKFCGRFLSCLTISLDMRIFTVKFSDRKFSDRKLYFYDFQESTSTLSMWSLIFDNFIGVLYFVVILFSQFFRHRP